MGWFNNTDKKEKEGVRELPELQELPELPNFPGLNNFENKKDIHKLPSFPSNILGNQFSQNIIKEAVSGEEGDQEVFEANEFAQEETENLRMMPQKPGFMKKMLKQKTTMEIPSSFRTKSYSYDESTEPEMSEMPSQFSEAIRKVKRAEPLFIRIDKFEESLELFEKIKHKISEMDKMLEEINQIKENEEKEIISWEREIQTIKQQIKKIDEDIFSKIE
jgi:hypothetical protein